MVITKIVLPRRTFLRGLGATFALPFLDAMVPAMSARAKAAPRFAAIYCGNGANMNDWTPATEGVGFAFSPILKPLEAFRDRTLVVTGLDNFPATDQGDSGGQHPRAAPAFMSCVHPKQTEAPTCRPARRSIKSSPRDLPRLEAVVARFRRRPQRRRRRLRPRLRLRLHELDVVEDADDAAAGRDESAFVFERMFGSGDTAEQRAGAQPGGPQHPRRRDAGDFAAAQTLGGRDGVKLGEYLDAIRDVEQRIAKANPSTRDLAFPDRPVGVPRDVQGTRRAHVRSAGAGVPGGHHAGQLVS